MTSCIALRYDSSTKAGTNLRCFIFRTPEPLAVAVHGIDKILARPDGNPIYSMKKAGTTKEVAGTSAFFTISYSPYVVECTEIVGVCTARATAGALPTEESGFAELYIERIKVDIGPDKTANVPSEAILIDHEVLIGMMEAKFCSDS